MVWKRMAWEPGQAGRWETETETETGTLDSNWDDDDGTSVVSPRNIPKYWCDVFEMDESMLFTDCSIHIVLTYVQHIRKS